MLSDAERKILRILYNYSSGRRRLPSMHELTIKTGRTKQDITEALLSLERQGFIEWPDKQHVESIFIIKGWEDEDKKKPRRPTSSNIDYWTQY